MPEQRTTFNSGDLTLEAAVASGDGKIAVLMLHPHPQYGGEMDNHVVTSVCAAMAQRGAATMRFNFRGAGCSEGAYDGGRGEADDARAAAAHLRAQAPNARLLLAGYSFGAMIAAAVADDVAPDALVLVSPPTGATAMPALDPLRRTLLVTGELDGVAPPAPLRQLASDTCEVHVVAGADHGWWPGVNELAEHIMTFAERTGLIT